MRSSSPGLRSWPCWRLVPNWSLPGSSERSSREACVWPPLRRTTSRPERPGYSAADEVANRRITVLHSPADTLRHLAPRTAATGPGSTKGGPNAEVPHARPRGVDARADGQRLLDGWRSEEHTSELQSR